MNNCQSCGYQRNDFDKKCPQCRTFYPTIAELIAEEEAYEEKNSFLGQCKRILFSGNIKHELLAELDKFKAELTKKGMFTIFLMIAFVFAFLLSVL
jgi:hypothetical protein